MPEAPPRRPPRPVFRPRFTLSLLYLAFFFFLFGMIFALPDLLQGARELGPGPEELTPEEIAQARNTAREALRGGRLFLALALAVVATGLGSYARLLPGLRGD
jgi:hypothetical protein